MRGLNFHPPQKCSAKGPARLLPPPLRDLVDFFSNHENQSPSGWWQVSIAAWVFNWSHLSIILIQIWEMAENENHTFSMNRIALSEPMGSLWLSNLSCQKSSIRWLSFFWLTNHFGNKDFFSYYEWTLIGLPLWLVRTCHIKKTSARSGSVHSTKENYNCIYLPPIPNQL